jgi:hypothetical protein
MMRFWFPKDTLEGHMNARIKSALAGLLIVVGFGLPSLVGSTAATEAREMALSERQTLTGGAPASRCQKNNNNCGDSTCDWDEPTQLCWKAVGFNYEQCVNANVAMKFCDETWGTVGNKSYCQHLWKGAKPMGQLNCGPANCGTQHCTSCWGAERPIGMSGMNNVCANGE